MNDRPRLHRSPMRCMAMAVVLTAAACGADNDPTTAGTTAEPTPTTTPVTASVVMDTGGAADVAEAIADRVPGLNAVARPSGPLLTDVSLFGALGDSIVTTVADLADALPESVPDDDERRYADVLAALDAWQAFGEDLADLIAADGDRLQLVADGWDRESELPNDLRTILDGIVEQADAFVDACAVFAVAFDVAPDCAGVIMDPDAVGPDEVTMFTLGELALEVETGPTGFALVETDILAFEVGADASVTFLAAPDVVDPGGPFGPELSSTVPWPDVVEDWAAAIPAESIDVRTVELASVDWQTRRFVATDPVALVRNEAIGGAHVAGSSVLQLWHVEIGGQVVVVVLDIAAEEADSVDDLVGRTERILTTLRVASGG